jgi:hypothetical protein
MTTNPDPDYSADAGTLADYLIRSLGALQGAPHDCLDPAQRNADIAALRFLDRATWPSPPSNPEA